MQAVRPGNGKKCTLCGEEGHSGSKCPDLVNMPTPAGGGGGHSHDDDENACLLLKSKQTIIKRFVRFSFL